MQEEQNNIKPLTDNPIVNEEFVIKGNSPIT